MKKLTKTYIKSNFFNSKNQINSNKIKEIIIPIEYKWCLTKSEYLFAILNDLKSRPKCLECNNTCNYISNGKYKMYCSSKCGNNSTLRIEKIKQTNLKKYGVDNFTKTEEYKEKVKQTNLEKYGTEYYMQTEEYKEKVKQINLEKYGTEYYMQTEEYKEKVKQTNLEKYGVDNFAKTEEYKEKVKQTNLEKYGVNHYMKNEKEKLKHLKKVKQTNLEKYGVEYVSQRNITNKGKLTKEYIEKNFICNGYIDFYEYMNFFNFKINTGYVYLRSLNVEYKTKTKIEEEINSLFNNVFVINDRNIIKPYEIDLLNETKKLAIEYNGLNFHSFGMSETNIFNNYREEEEYFNDKYKNKEKHLYKTEKMEEKKFHLFHVFENEWLSKETKEIWISKINLKLQNIKPNIIYGRKCKIKDLSKTKKDIKLVNDFIKQNHLQGMANSKIKIGLFYEEKLVMVMTFRKPRFNNQYEYELIRMCSKKNNIIIGGAKKLLNFFEKEYKPKSIISYGNRRWTNINDNIYDKLGFSFKGVSKPNFYYFSNNKINLEHRLSFQKHKLNKKLNKYDVNKTSKENIYLNGYRKIYDSGNLIYVKSYC